MSACKIEWKATTVAMLRQLQILASHISINSKCPCFSYPSKHDGLQKCIQYIGNRPGQFKYDEAIRKGLPIGSGKIESTHRHVIQKRLKKPGAWWRRDHAEQMANLRTLRANNEWERLWQGQAVCEPDCLAA